MNEQDRLNTEAKLQLLVDHGAAVSWTPEKRIDALTKLVKAMEVGMKIVQRHRAGDVEPYPGAVDGVIRTSIMGAQLARKSGLLS